MRRYQLPILRPTPALIVAIIVLLLATSGIAQGAPNPSRGEITLMTLSGSVTTTSPAVYPTGDTVQLNGQPTYAFTQAAGEAIQLIASVDIVSAEATLCDVTLVVHGLSGGSPLPLGARVDYSSEKGERGEGSGVGGLAAPTSDRTVTLRAEAWESGTCDGGDGGDAGPDTWQLALRVSVVTLRD